MKEVTKIFIELSGLLLIFTVLAVYFPPDNYPKAATGFASLAALFAIFGLICFAFED